MKRALNIIMYILFVVCVVVIYMQFAYSQMTANSNEVQKIVELANKTVDGQLITQEFFKRYPTPTNDNLNILIKLVDEITVRDIARQQTGDMTIKTKTELDLEKEKKETKEFEDFLKSYPIPFIKINFLQSIAILLGLSMFVFALSFFSRRNN